MSTQKLYIKPSKVIEAKYFLGINQIPIVMAQMSNNTPVITIKVENPLRTQLAVNCMVESGIVL